MRGVCACIAGAAGPDLGIEPTYERDSVAFDTGLMGELRAPAEWLGLAQQDIYLGTVHDDCNLARVAPTAMIFVPCEGGVSHNEAEKAKPEGRAAGSGPLLQVMVERAGSSGRGFSALRASAFFWGALLYLIPTSIKESEDPYSRNGARLANPPPPWHDEAC